MLVNPGAVLTSFAGEYDAATAAHVERFRRCGRPAARTSGRSPPASVGAFVQGEQIGPDDQSFDGRAAARLHDLTQKLVTQIDYMNK
ncbi:hypothetical protein [Nonomuraea dietziae]|uniref:hypothetical protein n=1 Tax=Nonomuraea dietziae TaxID=65515 RepID=UPI0034341409